MTEYEFLNYASYGSGDYGSGNIWQQKRVCHKYNKLVFQSFFHIRTAQVYNPLF